MLTLAALLLAPAADPKATDYVALFPDLGGMYTRLVLKSEVGKAEKPDTYKQTATYSWNGGRYETLTVTIARDPAFKDKYSAEAMKKEKTPPTEVELGKKKAYLWELAKDGGIDQVSHRLVVVLAADKVLLIEQIGSGAQLDKFAAKFDLEKVEKALDAPPK